MKPEEINTNTVPVATPAPAQTTPAPVVTQPSAPVMQEPVIQAPVTVPVAPVAPVQVTPAVPQPIVPAPLFELPQGVSPRTTQQFDKLTDSNKKLLEANQVLQAELARKKVTEAQIAPLQQLAQPQQPDVNQFVEVDPISGEKYINENKLQAAIVNANDRATRAEQQVTTYIQTEQNKESLKQATETFTKYPQLNPNDPTRFDPNLNKLTRAYALDSMANPGEYGGRTLSFVEAADLAARNIAGQTVATPSVEAQQASAQVPQPAVNPNTNVQIQPATQPVQSNVTKDQGSLAVEGAPINTAPAAGEEDLLSLQQATRKGDVWALAKRLTNVPHTGTPTHGEGE